MLHKTAHLTDKLYLEQLGNRVRGLRRQQAMNRKLLAERSGVSERFLAQLEVGSGNISVIRLRHIAQALDCSVSSLLDDRPSPPEAGLRKNRFALIGLRGAGKSTRGRLVAEELGIAFVELTECIERSSGLALADIFNLYGADGYRRLEQRELRAVIDEHDDCVLAPAGGVSENSETYDELLARFHTVWLTATPQEHLDRVIAQGDLRPMHGHDEAFTELKAILGSRASDYARCDQRLETAGRSVETSKQDLLDLIRAR